MMSLKWSRRNSSTLLVECKLINCSEEDSCYLQKLKMFISHYPSYSAPSVHTPRGNLIHEYWELHKLVFRADCFSYNKNAKPSWVLWYISVIPATQGVEARGWRVQSQLRQMLARPFHKSKVQPSMVVCFCNRSYWGAGQGLGRSWFEASYGKPRNQPWWCTPVIPATREVTGRRIKVEGWPQAKT
jgi:hypothetical protein